MDADEPLTEIYTIQNPSWSGEFNEGGSYALGDSSRIFTCMPSSWIRILVPAMTSMNDECWKLLASQSNDQENPGRV